MRHTIQTPAVVAAVAALLILTTGGIVLAAVTGSLQVEIRTPGDEPLPGATVQLSSPVLMGVRTAVTDAEGVARFNALPPGDYDVEASFAGSGKVVSRANAVRLDQLTLVPVILREEMRETVVVTDEAPLLDVTSTTIGVDLDVEYVEDLPTQRSYQTNLLLVPGVDIGSGGNPVVHGGTSRDNLYLIDGVNTTDPVTQTFGANINFDIIEEQQINTGGHKAEYGGVVGLVSNLVTKSGGNQWSGNLTYMRQDADWAASADNASGATETTAWQAAYTLGGPILRDRLWHFSSWEINETETTTFSAPGVANPPRLFESDYYFGKLTFQATQNHRLNLQVNGDPTDIPNVDANDLTLKPEQLSNQTQGGTNSSLRYTGVLGPELVLEAQATVVRQDLDVVPANPGAGFNVQSLFSSVTEQFGQNGNQQFSDRDRDELKADLTWFRQTRWGEHNLKFGVQYAETDFRSLNIGSSGQVYLDIPASQAANFDDLGDFVAAGFGSFAAFRFINAAELNGWGCSIDGVDCASVASVGNDPSTWLLELPDGAGGSTTVSAADLAFAPSVNADAAAAGWLRFEQDLDTRLDLASPVGQDILAFYAQDEWRLGRFTTYAGLRVEQQSLRDSNGDTYFEFDTTWSPRVGLTYDVRGNGREKAFVHYGRLYDPLSDGTTDFGDPTGDPQLDLQLWVDPLQDFFTYFSIGGPGSGAAAVAPNLKTPVTDELLVGWARNIGDTMSIEATYIDRDTTDVTEDLDPTRGPLDGSPSIESLGFGDVNGDGVIDVDDVPSAFIIYNPPGGERNYRGVDLVFRKRFAGNWTGLAGYTYGEFEGNVSADGQYGILGDDAYLDPRLPYNYGRLGDIFQGGGVGANDHLVRVNGSYRFPIGLTVGGTLTARSGTYYSLRSVLTPDGNVGDSRTPTIWNGDPAILVDSLGIAGADLEAFATAYGLPSTVPDGMGGTMRNPALEQAIADAIPFDLRAGRGAYENDWVYFFNLSFRYSFGVFKRLTGEAFLDVFNVFDIQHATNRDGAFAVQSSGCVDDQGDPAACAITPETVGVASNYTFGRALTRQAPRSIQAGFRFAF